jgi:hypothetical protein
VCDSQFIHIKSCLLNQQRDADTLSTKQAGIQIIEQEHYTLIYTVCLNYPSLNHNSRVCFLFCEKYLSVSCFHNKTCAYLNLVAFITLTATQISLRSCFTFLRDWRSLPNVQILHHIHLLYSLWGEREYTRQTLSDTEFQCYNLHAI